MEWGGEQYIYSLIFLLFLVWLPTALDEVACAFSLRGTINWAHLVTGVCMPNKRDFKQVKVDNRYIHVAPCPSSRPKPGTPLTRCPDKLIRQVN